MIGLKLSVAGATKVQPDCDENDAGQERKRQVEPGEGQCAGRMTRRRNLTLHAARLAAIPRQRGTCCICRASPKKGENGAG
jgi:hypothetical protein